MVTARNSSVNLSLISERPSSENDAKQNSLTNPPMRIRQQELRVNCSRNNFLAARKFHKKIVETSSITHDMLHGFGYCRKQKAQPNERTKLSCKQNKSETSGSACSVRRWEFIRRRRWPWQRCGQCGSSYRQRIHARKFTQLKIDYVFNGAKLRTSCRNFSPTPVHFDHQVLQS